jgi:hypothetical protein
MKTTGIKITGLGSLIILFTFMCGANSMTYAAESRVTIDNSTITEASKRTKIKTPISVKGNVPVPAKGNVPGSGGANNKYAGSCCASPSPFPGLYCCDTRDCGWFSCGDNISGKKKIKANR